MRQLILSAVSVFCMTQAHAMTLYQVYLKAIHNDQTYVSAQATWAAARQNLPIARAAWLPSVTLSAYYQRFHNTQSGQKADDDNFNYTASLTQTVFDYSAWKALQEASFSVKAARATLAEAAQTVMTTTVSDYFAVLEAIEQVEVSKQTLQYLKQVYTQIREKYQVGMATTADLYAAQSALDLQAAALLSDQHDVDIAMEALAVLTGERYQTLMGIERIKLVPPTPNRIEDWARRAMQNNYALKASFYSTEAAKEAVKVAYGGRLPTLSVRGSFDRTSQHSLMPGGASGAPLNEALLSLNASFPAYQGGAVSALGKQAHHAYLAALAGFKGLRRQTLKETRTYFLSVQYNMHAIEANRLAVTSAESALEANQAAYKAGTATLEEVLESLKDVSSAKQALINARYQYLLNITQLKQSIGTLKASDMAALSKILTHPITLTNIRDTHATQQKTSPH